MVVMVVLETVCGLLTKYWLAPVPNWVIIVPAIIPDPVNVLPMVRLPEETELTVSTLPVMEPVNTAHVHAVNMLQSWKALSPIETKMEVLVYEDTALKVEGISIIVNELQPWKALAPMDVHEGGSAILVNALQPWNALGWIDAHA